jgi:hypothetical protein
MGCHEGLKSSLRSLAVRPSEIYLLVFFIHVSQSISRRSFVDHSRNAIAIPPASTLTKLCQSFFSCTSLSVSSKALHCALTRKIYPCQCHVLPSKEDLSSSRGNIQFSIFASSFTPAASVTTKDISFYSRAVVRTTRDQIRYSPFLRPCRVPLSSDCRFHPRRAGMRSPEGYSL